MDVERYLRRIGHQGRAEPDAETLAALQRAHLLTVPFDALDCRLGRPVSVEPADAYRKVVEERRGGFCFELNGLFGWLLEELGYDVTLLAARPFAADGGLAPSHAHMTLMVRLERRWLVDVGFGHPFALTPLDLDLRSEQEREGRHFLVAPQDEALIVQECRAPGRRGYVFSLQPAAREAFAERCHIFATDPQSQFVRHGPVLQAFEDGWVKLTATELSGVRGGRPLQRKLRDSEDWRAQLREWFGIEVRGAAVRATAALRAPD